MSGRTAAISGSGTQVIGRAQAVAAQLTGLPPEKVVVHNHLLGGGFGRRLEVDFIARAVEIAKQVDGPVKIVWSREADVQHAIKENRKIYIGPKTIVTPSARDLASPSDILVLV